MSLPLAADELVGRDTEITEAVRLLGTARLLTLSGTGGVGKTRLAMAVAHQLSGQYQAGSCWVPLAPLASGSPVVAVGSALGLRAAASPYGADGVTDEIADQVADRELLLVLDNCEHVLDEVAKLCAVLLARCPRLRILATSRELLRIPGETVLPVPPLSVPVAGTDQLEDSPAVQLFRVRAAARGLAVADDALPDAARVVRRLQGIPLAIELAAARTNVLTVAQIADELARSFQILGDGPRTAAARHQTLHGAIEWSYQLLTTEEQRLFEALSVFAGGWTLPAAEAVYGEPGVDVLTLTGRLADKSLIVVRRDHPEARYEMLAVIGEYGRRRLADSGRRADTERRHAEYYLAYAEQAEAALHAPAALGDEGQTTWLDRLDAELDNLRTAIAWATTQADSAPALQLAGALWNFCYLRGHYAEGRHWLGQALRRDQPDAPPTPVRARALLGAGMLAFLQCEYDTASTRIEAARDLYQALGDTAGRALAVHRLGGIARERAQYYTAKRLHLESLELFAQRGDRTGTAWARNHLGFVCWLRGDLAEAAEQCTRALAEFRALGDGEGIVWGLINLGAVAHYRAELEQAELQLHEALALSERLGYAEGVAWARNQLGLVELRRGRIEKAGRWLSASLAVHRELGDRWRTASVVEALAAVAVRRDQSAYAAFLLGAATALREAIGAPIPACELPDRDRVLAAARSTLDSDDFAAAWAAGRAAPLASLTDGYPPGG
ncbi:MAG: ATP-binding protein [Micromonosporaceae bacterium]